jgi:hypothetical protein
MGKSMSNMRLSEGGGMKEYQMDSKNKSQRRIKEYTAVFSSKVKLEQIDKSLKTAILTENSWAKTNT